MTRVRSTEEPCASKGACTVLETSGGSDSLAEFNRALRFAVLWCRMMQGTYNAKGDRFHKWSDVASLPRSCSPVFDPQVRDLTKVCEIPRQERRIMGECNSCDLQVHRPDMNAGTTEPLQCDSCLFIKR